MVLVCMLNHSVLLVVVSIVSVICAPYIIAPSIPAILTSSTFVLLLPSGGEPTALSFRDVLFLPYIST